MKKKFVALFLLSSLLLQSCGGVSQTEYDKLLSEKDDLSSQLEDSKKQYSDLLKEHKECIDQDLAEASSDLDFAFPKALVSTYLCDEYTILSDDNDYVEITCKDSYEFKVKSIRGIYNNVKKMISGMVYMQDSLVFDRMCFKFLTDDGEEILSYTFKKGDDTYSLDSVSINIAHSDVINAALSSK